MDKIQLVVADDHPIVRLGLRSIFSKENDICLVAEADSGDAAIALAQQFRPHVLLTETIISGCSGKSLLRQLKRFCPDTAVLVLSQQREEHHAISLLRAGAKGFINKERSAEDIVDATRQVARGDVFITRELSQRIAVAAFGEPKLKPPHEHLSEREHEVFLKLVQGRTVGEIATRLHLSPKTVSTHKARILQKLGMTSTSALVRYALEHELL